ncbi:hypothetical protein [Gimesia panareensis]|uniref:hypothetical protein n=1 Tax=Gimesia panareensis TaxID=2527978 RepID=UPI0021BCCFDD|nr:hypothetical protein [Gimesia panareensis]
MNAVVKNKAGTLSEQVIMMSDELPSKKELAKLPRFSIAVYALRCAMRVQPLLTLCMKPTTEYKKTVVKLNNIYRFLIYDANATDIGGNAVAAAALDSAAATARAANDVTGIAAANVAAIAAAATINAYNGVDAANIASGTAADAETITAAAIIAADTITAADADTITAAARADYVGLLELDTEVTDASEFGPLGVLWHGSPPDWYIEVKERYEEIIAEWELEVGQGESKEGNLSGSANIKFSTSGDLSGIEQSRYEITIQVPVGEDDETAIKNATKLVTYIDELHKAKGGSGVKIDLLEIFESSDVLVPSSPEGS